MTVLTLDALSSVSEQAMKRAKNREHIQGPALRALCYYQDC